MYLKKRNIKKFEDDKKIVNFAVCSVNIERLGLEALEKELKNNLSKSFIIAVKLISSCSGHVIITGIGKSGHVGKKIAATLSSTGTPSFFVHAAEASHGDLGMIKSNDVILAFSWSGETIELKNIISYSRRFHIPLIAVTSKKESILGRKANILLLLPKINESCPYGLAPTTSSIMQLALGDALAISLLKISRFSKIDFKILHPGGILGKNLP